MPRKFEPKVCVVCDKEYKPKALNQKYCCGRCKSQGNPDVFARGGYVILERDNFQCAYCGATSYGDRVKLHLDHILPKALGGEDIASNLITACRSCNLSKSGNKMRQEVMDKVLFEIKRRNKRSQIIEWIPINLTMVRT